MKNYQIKEEHIGYYEFLEALRKSGNTNMFGAAPYLVARFKLSKKEAFDILSEWVTNYDEIDKRWNIRERIKPC